MTISEIAKAAGVSIATVSRYLNNGSIKEETKQKLEQVILDLNYVPQSMTHKKINNDNRTIAVVTHSMSNNYSMEFAEAISTKCEDLDTMFYLGCCHEHVREYQYLMDLVSKGINGIILHEPPGPYNRMEMYQEVASHVPLVVVHSAPVDYPVNSVTVDQQTGMKKAMNYLLENGHKNILFIRGQRNVYPFNIKEKIWKEELKTAGLDEYMENMLRVPGSDYEGAVDKTEELLTEYLKTHEKPSAIFTCNDLIALGVLKSLRKARLSVPDDVSVVSHDNTVLASSANLTSVDMKIRSVALAALDLLEYATNGDDTTPRHVSITSELIMRDSTLPLVK